MSNKNIRIKDIAERAGVSVGTVDRVLHNRGRVSEDALKKVMTILEGIDYKPNLIARTLGSNKTYKIAALVPNPTLDVYWAQSMAGIYQAESEWAKYGVVVEHFLFHQYDKQSFENAANAVLEANPDGVLIAPIFYREALPYFFKFKENQIPFVLFNTNIPEVKPLSFIGQELYQSGRVAAELMSLGQTDKGTFVILHIQEDIPNSVHLLEKAKGFREYFDTDDKRDFEVKTLSLNDPGSERFEREIMELGKDPAVHGLFISTSKSFLVGAVLQKHNLHGLRVIGYDLLKENLQYLKSGVIQFIINQNPSRQTFIGINHLANSLIFKTPVPKTNYLPLEVITRENVHSHLHNNNH